MPTTVPTTDKFLNKIIFFLLYSQLVLGGDTLHSGHTTLPVFTITMRGLPRNVTINTVCTRTLYAKGITTLPTTLTLSVNVTIRGLPRKTVMSVPLRTGKRSGLNSFALNILSNIIRPVNTLLAVLTTNVTMAVLPCLLNFTTKTVVCTILRRFKSNTKVFK